MIESKANDLLRITKRALNMADEDDNGTTRATFSRSFCFSLLY